MDGAAIVSVGLSSILTGEGKQIGVLLAHRALELLEKMHAVERNGMLHLSSTSWLSGKESPTSAEDSGDVGSIPGSGRSPEEGNGNPLQYSCLEDPVNRGLCEPGCHRVAKSQAQLSD